MHSIASVSILLFTLGRNTHTHTQVDLVAYQHLAHFTSYQGKVLIGACGLRLLSGFGSIMRLITCSDM